jgi:hypothetical protein
MGEWGLAAWGEFPVRSCLHPSRWPAAERGSLGLMMNLFAELKHYLIL